MSLIVAGSTGAIGREVVKAAVEDARITRIVALSRRNIAPEQFAATFGEDLNVSAATGRLQVVGVDWEKLTNERESYLQSNPTLKAAFEGHQYACNALGTTRADAGSAEAFRRVDLDYMKTFVAAQQALNPNGLRHFAQISASTAKESSWLLYNQTKGEADAFVEKAGIAAVSIFRPGLLERGDKMRGVEKFAKLFMFAMPVATIGKCVLARFFTENAPSYTVLYNDDILKTVEPEKQTSGCCKS